MKKLLILIMCFFLTGCYDYKDLRQLSIVSAISIDKQGSLYDISIQVINNNKDNSDKFFIYNSKGKNIQEAINNSINSTGQDIYLGHLNVVLINENLAKEDISEIFDFFYRSSSTRIDFLPVICKDYNCKDIINVKTLTEQLNAKNIKFLIEHDNTNIGIVKSVTFTDLLNDYLNPYNDMTLPSITKKNDDLYIDTMSYFKENKLYGYLTDTESIMYNIINNNISTSNYTIPCSNYFSIDLIKNNTDFKYKDNTLYINIELKSNLSECNCNVDLNNNGIDLLNNYIEEYFSENINKLITKMVDNEIDIFKFKDFIYKNTKKEVNLKDINFKVNVKSNIDNTENGIEEI